MSNKKDSYYFSHDSNARNDLKMVRLRRQLGLEGYGCFWCLIELLRETADYKLPLSSLDDIAFDINISVEKLTAVVKNYDLFVIEEDNFFYSRRLHISMEQYSTNKLRLSEGGKKGMEKRWANNNKTKPDIFI